MTKKPALLAGRQTPSKSQILKAKMAWKTTMLETN